MAEDNDDVAFATRQAQDITDGLAFWAIKHRPCEAFIVGKMMKPDHVDELIEDLLAVKKRITRQLAGAPLEAI